MTARASGPLEGLRVVEISSYVATPLCGLVLRQLGADVIRVEPLAGSPDRSRLPRAADGTSLYWAGLNGGKRDLAIDLDRAEAQAIVADLICGTPDDLGAGLVVTNTERYPDLAFTALSERRPDLVQVLLTGTRDGASAVDYTVQASTGYPLVSGPPDSTRPVNGVLPAWDIAAGLYLTVGVLAALHERGRTGRGQQVRIALEDVAFAITGSLGLLAEAQLGGEERCATGNDVLGTFGTDFVCADGIRFMLVVLTRSHWRRLLDVTGLDGAVGRIETTVGADFDNESERWTHRRVLFALLDGWFRTRTWAEVEPVVAAARILISRYRSFADLAADGAAAMRAMPLFEEIEQPGAGRWQAPGLPLVMGGRYSGPAPAPRVGADTEQVLAEVGLTPERIARLRTQGCVG